MKVFRPTWPQRTEIPQPFSNRTHAHTASATRDSSVRSTGLYATRFRHTGSLGPIRIAAGEVSAWRIAGTHQPITSDRFAIVRCKQAVPSRHSSATKTSTCGLCVFVRVFRFFTRLQRDCWWFAFGFCGFLRVFSGWFIGVLRGRRNIYSFMS